MSEPVAWIGRRLTAKVYLDLIPGTAHYSSESVALDRASLIERGYDESEIHPLYVSPPSATRESGWQPIETAPKTGPVENLLLYVPELHGTGGKVIAHWAHGGGEDQPRFGPDWFFWTGYGFSAFPSGHKPTHWMRLPHCPADWRPDPLSLPPERKSP